jgi:hypothetical protein
MAGVLLAFSRHHRFTPGIKGMGTENPDSHSKIVMIAV